MLFAVLLLLLPKTDDVSKKKMVSAAMLMCSKDFRKQVVEQLHSAEPGELGELPFNNSCPNLIASVDVDEAGKITLRGSQHGIRMVLTPKIASGNVRWSCQGQPAEIITPLCKP